MDAGMRGVYGETGRQERFVTPKEQVGGERLDIGDARGQQPVVDFEHPCPSLSTLFAVRHF